MRVSKCDHCGSMDFLDKGSYLVCAYCRTKYDNEDVAVQLLDKTTISVASDIESLLKKCQEDPANRQRYASLILDIDPTNLQAIHYLN